MCTMLIRLSFRFCDAAGDLAEEDSVTVGDGKEGTRCLEVEEARGDGTDDVVSLGNEQERSEFIQSKHDGRVSSHFDKL